MARPDPENVYLDLDSLILERQMPLILQDCVSRETLEKEVCDLFMKHRQKHTSRHDLTHTEGVAGP